MRPPTCATSASPSAARTSPSRGGDVAGHAQADRRERISRTTGKMDFVDNAIDRSSGTIRGRARVRQSGRHVHARHVRRASTCRARRPTTALLVPDVAIGTEQARKFVLVVDADDVARAEIRHARASSIDGLRVVKDGLERRRPRHRQRPDARAPRRRRSRRRSRARAAAGSAGARPQAKARTESGQPMRISHFFIDRPIFAAVVSIVFVILGGVSLRAPAGRAISRDRAADHQRHRPVSRRQRRGRRRHRRRADRAADQRRREHALHVVELDGRRPLLDRGHASISAPISISRRCRCRTAWRSRSRGCRPTCATSASRSPRLRPT